MKRLAFVIFALVSFLAVAANVHLKPPNRNPTFADGGLFLQVAGSLSGLGNGDVVVGLAADGNVFATCANPSGHNQPPGQNPAPITVTGTNIIPEDEIKNGTVSFNVRTTSPTTPIAGAPDCPNRQWSEDIQDIQFTSGTLTVEQPAGSLTLQVSCTFSPPTANGAVPISTVACALK